jgi:hypothetical protein
MTISVFLALMNGVLITAVLILFFRSLNLQSKMDALHFRRLNEMNDLYKERFEAMEDEIANLRRKHEALPCARTNDAASEVAEMVKEVLEEKMPIMKNVHAFMVNIRDTERIKAIVPNLPIDILEALLEKTEVEQIYETAAVVAVELKTRKTQKSAQ